MLTRTLNLLQGKIFRTFSTPSLAKVKTTSLEDKPKLDSDTIELEEFHLKKSLEHEDYFKVFDLFTVKDLFDARVHYGHKVTSLNNKMKPFLFGNRLGHLIFDLDITAFHLREALNFIAHIAFRDGIILFVSRNPRMSQMVDKTAQECQEFAISREFRKGLFTNMESIFKQEVRLPDLCIVLNTLEQNGEQHPIINEAARMCIPTVGIVDTNCDPNLICYPVPGNDDSPSSVKLYCKLFKRAIMKGKNKRKEIFGSSDDQTKYNINTQIEITEVEVKEKKLEES